jgi:hypothetical protein
MYRNISTDVNQTSDAIREYYFGDKKIDEEVMKELTNMYSDRYFFHSTHHAAKLAALQIPVYLYLFNYKGTQSLAQDNDNKTQNVDYGESISQKSNVWNRASGS